MRQPRHNHDQLFGDRVSTLARTDPELVGNYFDNFAFGDVIAHSDLDLHTQLAALISPARPTPSTG